MARHYGIPYMGSKQKLVDKIVPFILNRHPKATDFYDLFGGGGSVSLYAARKYPNLNVHYNELSTAIGGLMEHLQKGGELSFDWVSRKEFAKLKDGGDWRAGLMQTVWSFGNKTSATFLYGKNIQDYKHELHKAAVDGEHNFSTIETMAKDILARYYSKDLPVHVFINPKYKTPYQRRIVLNRQVPLIGALQHLGRMERLMQIQKMPGLDRINVSYGKSYDDVAIGGGASYRVL